MPEHITPELALRVEADVRERAGQITHSQGLALIRSGRPDPLARLALRHVEVGNKLAAALRELHSVCLAMDLDDEAKRPTEAEYQAAMAQAAAALAEH